MPSSRQAALSLYRRLLRKGSTLQYTDKEFYFRRIRQELEKNRNIVDAEEAAKCLEAINSFKEMPCYNDNPPINNSIIYIFMNMHTMFEEKSIDFIAAIKYGNIELVTEMLSCGVSQGDLDDGLSWACRAGSNPIVQKLLQQGANPKSDQWNGFTPLILSAMYSKDPTVLQTLLLAGSNPDAASHNRMQTALHAAVIQGCDVSTCILLKAGADVDFQDYLRRAPLMYAIQHGHPKCAKWLIRNNCDVNKPGIIGDVTMCPLYFSMVRESLEITKMLVLAGAMFERPPSDRRFFISEFYETISGYKNCDLEVRPPRLKQQCRIYLRHLFRPKLFEKLQTLAVPQVLKEYLLLPELDSIINYSE